MNGKQPASNVSVVQIDDEERSVMEWVALSEIRTDSTYQRPLPLERAIKALAQAWDTNKVGVIYLSWRDGVFYVIDGQTRVAAARLVMGDEGRILARVYVDLTVAEEAELFDAFNRDRRHPTALDTFRARLAYGEPAALDMVRILGRHGVVIGQRNAHSHWDVIGAVTALDHVYERWGPEVLSVVVGTLKAGLEEDPHTFTTSTLEGMAAFLARYPTVNVDRVISVLQRKGANGMQRTAEAIRETIINPAGGTAWGRALYVEYNRGLRNAVLAEWQDRFQGSIPMKRYHADLVEHPSGIVAQRQAVKVKNQQ